MTNNRVELPIVEYPPRAHLKAMHHGDEWLDGFLVGAVKQAEADQLVVNELLARLAGMVKEETL